MDILFLSTWFPYPPDNGSKLRVSYLLRALAKAHRVSLVSFAFGTARPDKAEDLRAMCCEVHVVRADPFAVNRAGPLRTFLSPRPVASRPIKEMSRLVADVIRGDRFDAVISSTEMMADYALQAPPSVARILEEHNSTLRWSWERYQSQESPIQSLRRWISWQKARHYEARLLRKFDMCTMVSDQDRAASVAMLPGPDPRIEVVPVVAQPARTGVEEFGRDEIGEPRGLQSRRLGERRRGLGRRRQPAPFECVTLPREPRERGKEENGKTA